MTVNVHLLTIATSIANLSIQGVSVRDVDNIPDAAMGLCPLLIPQPNDYVTDIKPTVQSFGFNGGAKLDLEYTLNYVYLHCETGSGMGAFEVYAGVLENLVNILVAILRNDVITGAVDMKIEKISNIGTVEDPAGNQFWGILFSLRVMEHAQ